MTLFELLFGLTAVILGLALAHMAGTAQQLAFGGKRVKWGIEPLLLAAIIFLAIIETWIAQWSARAATSMTAGDAVIEVLKMLMVYFAAASVLPTPRENDETIDLLTHYDRTRRLTYGSLIVSLLLFAADDVMTIEGSFAVRATLLLQLLLMPAVYLSLIVIRWRPYNIALLGAVLVSFGFAIANWRISQ